MICVRLWILLLLMVCIGGCRTARSPVVHHVVVCWLKEPGNEAHRAAVIEASESLREISFVETIDAGRVLPSGRKIVDSSFDVAIHMTFSSEKELALYLAHPVHKRAVKETLGPLVEKLVVYDFVSD